MKPPITPSEAKAAKRPVARAAASTSKARGAAASKSAPDALSGLPPMPKTKARAKPAAKPAAKPQDGPSTVTKKELFTRVKARTHGVKGSEVRQVMDALLDEIGAALVAGESFKLPALGTLKVQRHKPITGADVVICKLRRKKPASKAKDPLAKPAEDG